MEWTAAVGVASSILTFLTFANEVIDVYGEIRKGGSTADNTDRSRLIASLKAAAIGLNPPSADPGQGGVSEHAQALAAIAVDCEKQCNELLDLLDTLVAPTIEGESNAGRWWRRGRVAVKATRQKSTIDSLQAKIDQCRSMAAFHLELLLR